MAYRLKNRNKPLPGGVCWRDPGTGWQSAPFTSFEQQAIQIQQARIGNPGMTRRYRLSTDLTAIQNELDVALGQIAFQNGWTDYYVETGLEQRDSGGVTAPFPQRPRSLKKDVANIVDGSIIVAEWLKTAKDAVPQEQAEARAAVCAICPKNEQGDFTRWLTKPFSTAVKKAIEFRNGLKLSTSHDAKLNICTACLCPLALKVHSPFEIFWPHMDDESKAALDGRCWIISEAKGRGVQ